MSIAQIQPEAERIPFFDDDYLAHDLRHGTLFNRSGTKMCFMPSELIAAFHRVLEDETGDAWRDILKSVGNVWGRRVARRMTRELQDYYGRPLHELPMTEMVKILEAYFSRHGWGLLRLDFSHANDGIILATMRHSAFVEIIGASTGPVDSIVAGLLGEFFCEISERTDIDCHETDCTAMGSECCRFIIGNASRLADVPGMLQEGRQHDSIVRRLLNNQDETQG